MKAFAVLFLAGAALATPAHLAARADSVCSGVLYSQAQCCSTDVLGVADLDCAVPSSTPKDGDDFKSICSGDAKSAKCCTLPLAGLGILCANPA